MRHDHFRINLAARKHADVIGGYGFAVVLLFTGATLIARVRRRFCLTSLRFFSRCVFSLVSPWSLVHARPCYSCRSINPLMLWLLDHVEHEWYGQF